MTLKKIYLTLLLVAALFTGSIGAQASDYSSYLSDDQVPNSAVFLPLPSDSADAAFVGDYARWVWGKSLRPTARGQQASWESKFGMPRMCTIYSALLGIDINADNTPAIYQFMYRSGHTGGSVVGIMKRQHFRKRPFLLMNEDVWGEFDHYSDLAPGSAYPSSHTGFAWSVAMALAEMVPALQDTILRRGYEYGISRVIVGAHWQSDVDAAIMCSSAAFCCAHNNEQYATDLAAARSEYLRLKGLSESDIESLGYPKIEKILDPPYSKDDMAYMGDVAQYWSTKALRNGERGSQAEDDEDITSDYLLSIFSQCTTVPISATETPAISMLVNLTELALNTMCKTSQNAWPIKRPYVQMGEPIARYSPQWYASNDNAYPSQHAMLGWGIAMALAEAIPGCQDALLKRGLDYGYSRVITGYSYPSYVEAGRIMASCAMINLHNSEPYNSVMQNAKAEWEEVSKQHSVESIIARSSLNPTAWYTLAGIVLPSQPTIAGIYIHNGKKIAIK